ncbi:MAG: DUF2490 domain-containing protein [Bryobacteraceae bacterium]
MRLLLIRIAMALGLLAANASGQTILNNNFNAWWIYNGQHPIADKWDVHLEAHLRVYQAITSWQQGLLRAGLLRSLGPRWSVGGGYTNLRSGQWGPYPIPAPTNEHRIHQQVAFRHKTGAWDWQQRLRWEERWIHDRGVWRYQNRLRQYTRASVPFRPGSPWYFAASNELWFNVPPNVSKPFDQNRTVVSIGKRLTRANRVEFGYMYQPRWQRNGIVLESNHTLVFTWLSTARWRKS